MKLREVVKSATAGPWYAAIPSKLGDQGAEDYALVLLEDPESVAWNSVQHKEGKPWYFDVKHVVNAWTSEMGGVVMEEADATHIATFDPTLVGLMVDVCAAESELSAHDATRESHELAHGDNESPWRDHNLSLAVRLDNARIALAAYMQEHGYEF